MGKTGSLSFKLGTSFFNNTHDMMELTDIDVLLRDAADLCRKQTDGGQEGRGPFRCVSGDWRSILF